MDPDMKAFILDLLARHNLLRLATVRDDGYPQATTVTYANDDLTLYAIAGADAQKVRNIRRSDKVSLTIDHDEPDWNRIKGLSMAATAEILSDPKEIARALNLIARKFPAYAELVKPELLAQIAVIAIKPKVISVLNYERGFGHTDLVEV